MDGSESYFTRRIQRFFAAAPLILIIIGIYILVLAILYPHPKQVSCADLRRLTSGFGWYQVTDGHIDYSTPVTSSDGPGYALRSPGESTDAPVDIVYVSNTPLWSQTSSSSQAAPAPTPNGMIEILDDSQRGKLGPAGVEFASSVIMVNSTFIPNWKVAVLLIGLGALFLVATNKRTAK